MRVISRDTLCDYICKNIRKNNLHGINKNLPCYYLKIEEYFYKYHKGYSYISRAKKEENTHTSVCDKKILFILKECFNNEKNIFNN